MAQVNRNEKAIKQFEEANERMHHAMAIEFTGEVDQDFVRGMIPHHQGAVEMAQIALDHCSDESLKALARDIIAAQEKEIAFLRDWLERHSG